jgi:hypothetical protein
MNDPAHLAYNPPLYFAGRCIAWGALCVLQTQVLTERALRPIRLQGR